MKKSEEKEILKALESGEIGLVRPTDAFAEKLAEAADNTFKKEKRINIRLSNHDLVGIQRKASKKGIPYQALISGLIHQYVEGDLIEKSG